MRTASVDDKLQDLISKSDVIVTLLQGQLDMLNEQKTRVETNLSETLDDRERTVSELEQVRADIVGMDPAIIELETKISVEQDAATPPSSKPSLPTSTPSTTRWCKRSR